MTHAMTTKLRERNPRLLLRRSRKKFASAVLSLTTHHSPCLSAGTDAMTTKFPEKNREFRKKKPRPLRRSRSRMRINHILQHKFEKLQRDKLHSMFPKRTIYSYPMSMNQTVMPCIMGTPVRDQKNANVRIISSQSRPPPPAVRRRPIKNRPSMEATCCPEKIMLPLDMGCETRGSKFVLRRRDVSKKDQDCMMDVAMHQEADTPRPTKANIVEIKGECIPVFTKSRLPREGRIIQPRFDFPLSQC
jgi:hypothetical protein